MSDNLEALWRSEESLRENTTLLRTVKRQTYVWFCVLAIEVVGLMIGLVVPLLKIISTPELFWMVWALDIWCVVGVAGWFVVTRARHLLVETDQATEAYVQLLMMRYRHQITTSRAGIVLGALQFVILPLLMWWQLRSMDAEFDHVVSTYGGVLLVMVVYIATMLRVAASSQRKIARLANGYESD